MVEAGIGDHLLRRHVGRRADGDADTGEHGLRRGIAHGARHAEVDDEGVLVGDEDVVGLDVAMDDAGAVGLGEGVGDLAKPAHRQRNGDRPLAVDAFPEGLAIDQGHDVVEQRSFARQDDRPAQDDSDLAAIDEAEDVGVLELGGDADFAEEAITAQRGGEVGAQHLDRHLPLVADILGDPDRGHAALPEQALEPVASLERRREAAGGIGWQVGHA